MTTVYTVYRYRIYCTTEESWVYSYGTSEPSTCVNNTAHTVNPASVQTIDTISSATLDIGNNYTDTIQSSRVVEQTPIIDLKSFHGITAANKTSTSGTASVSCTVGTDSEIKLSINGGGDSAFIRSSKRGYYIAGMVSEVGIATRVPVPLDSGNVLKYGYFDEDNGYYFKLVGTQLNVGVMYNGSEILVPNSGFNKNKLDGSESNGITLDLAKGNIFRIDFTWYGFGRVTFGVLQTDSSDTQKFFPLHVYNTYGHTSCRNPYLPINIQFSSNGSAVLRDVYIAGRQYSILGKSLHNESRKMYIERGVTSSDTNTNALFSLRHKTNYKTCSVQIKKIYATANTGILLQIIKNATTSGIFIDNMYVDESCLQVDTSSITNGTVYKSFLLFANVPIELDVDDCDMYEDDTLSFTWKSSVLWNTIDISVEWDEQW